jgi:asparagine synthase (glutamine-hydrolysing)
LIAGVVSWEPGERRAGEELGAIVARLPLGSTPQRLGEGAVGLATGAVVESTPDVWAIADLDLTNADELRTSAAAADGALLASLYRAEGVGFVRRLRGAFSLALWDRRQQVLLLAVDRFGIARLHYAVREGRIAFAGRPSAVAGPELRVDLDQVNSYLNFGFIAAPASIFAGVSRLAPGCRLVGRRGAVAVERYWDMAYPERPISEPRAAEAVYRATEAAVDEALRGLSAKNVGTFLSGGTDSSTVTALLGRISGERVSAFSIGFEDERYDEMAYAELAARHVGASHYTRTVTADDGFRVVPRLVEAYDEPYGNNSAIGTLLCAELAQREGVSTLLAGDGGDEIFGGNERYRMDRILARYHLAPAPFRRGLLEPALRRAPEWGVLGKAQRYVRRANIPMPDRFYSYRLPFLNAAADLLADDFRRSVAVEGPLGVVRDHFHRVDARSELNRLLYVDLKLTIGDDDLLKVTRTAELARVGVRFPLLDQALVELTGELPARLKMRGLEKRYLFKKAFRALLPPETLAKRKHGFGVPTSLWLKTDPAFRDLARDTLLSTRARQRGYFRPGALETLMDLHAADTSSYYGDVLWTVLMLELWQVRHVDGAVRP